MKELTVSSRPVPDADRDAILNLPPGKKLISVLYDANSPLVLTRDMKPEEAAETYQISEAGPGANLLHSGILFIQEHALDGPKPEHELINILKSQQSAWFGIQDDFGKVHSQLKEAISILESNKEHLCDQEIDCLADMKDLLEETEQWILE